MAEKLHSTDSNRRRIAFPVVATVFMFILLHPFLIHATPCCSGATDTDREWVLTGVNELWSGVAGAGLLNPETDVQAPVLIDLDKVSGADPGFPIAEGEGWELLHEGSSSAGAPFRISPRCFGYTAGSELVIFDREDRLPAGNWFNGDPGSPLEGSWWRTVFDLGCDARKVAVSPDFSKAVFTDCFAAAVRMLDLSTGSLATLMEVFEGVPAWSPDGKFLAVVHSGIGIRLIDISDGSIYPLIGFREMNSGFSLFGTPEWKNPGGINSILEVPYLLTTGRENELSCTVSINPRKLDRTASPIDLDQENNGIELTIHTGPGDPSPGVSFVPAGIMLEIPTDLEAAETCVLSSRVGGVPYIHQVYDTPDWFDGNWACGPTSCLMAVQKYKKLPYWLCRASWPGAHNSFWGNFISGQFTHNDVTYSSVSYDPSGRPARGLYGYICPGGSAYWDRMNNFMQWAGCTTYYDSSPSWSELTAQLDSGRPVVMGTMLTEYGHIVTATGYYSNHSVIVRDPYGNKASGYPNYESLAVYDWPGYNNGNYNLNSVSLLIGVSASSSGLAAMVDDETQNVPRCRFKRNGPPEWFWESDYYGTGSPGGGHSYTNGMIYTYSEPSGSWTNWVSWGVNITSAGNYRFEVFIPQNLATTTSAKYYHYHSATGQTFMKSVNQNLYYDEWVTLNSSYYCRTGWNYIQLGDVTGESTAKMIGIDAIRVTRR